MSSPPTLAELTQFGIQASDEGRHPFDAEDVTWQESLFYDWYNPDGQHAGHLRIGVMPVQRRVWFWLYLFDGERWLAVDESRLPLAELDWDAFRYDFAGLRFERSVGEPLLENRVQASAFARVVSGPDVGRILPVSLDLHFEGIGPCHSVGDTGVTGHSHEELSANRFEQPTRVRGEVRVDETKATIDGRGERDHSWGPRMWNMAWRFLVLNGEQMRMQAVEVSFGGGDDDAMHVGYLSDASGTSDIDTLALELEYPDDVHQGWEGRLNARYESGAEVSGTLTSLATAEIDATHAFMPPQPSIYRRSLVRFTPDDGGASCLGWMEINRFPNGIDFGEDA